MKTVQKTFSALAFIIVLASCQSSGTVTQVLSDPASRKAMMDSIANDSSMCKDMMNTMMNSKNGKMIMMHQHSAMMKTMKDDPNMMKGMMTNMMEMCKNDTTMMCDMCQKMMDNPKMMDMMHKMKGEKMNMDTMMGMNKMKEMNHKSHH